MELAIGLMVALMGGIVRAIATGMADVLGLAPPDDDPERRPPDDG